VAELALFGQLAVALIAASARSLRGIRKASSSVSSAMYSEVLRAE
jgi:hypothetical protein